MRIVRTLARIESRLPRRRRAGEQPLIQPFPGYATPEHVIAWGRVLGRAVDHRRVISSFRTRELPGVAVAGGPEGVLTDDEGYFTLRLPRGAGEGWIGVPVAAGGACAVLPVLLPRADARIGVISDIDDTVMLTRAWSLPRNLWTSLRGRPDTRLVFADAVALLRRLGEGGRNPVFYVSTGPWNLLPFLEEVFRLNGLPRGPMFLRDWGVSEDHVVAVPAETHKARAIDTVLAANPGLRFVLLGDTGQKDAAIYLAAARRHPGRIAGVFLRRAGPRAAPSLEEFAALGIPAAVVEDFSQVPDPV
ncbi:MAG: DUF2183 domain-containing protein [Rubellimicrobium sp.]|nr:DUF2183 domain-containing protein [Rubellimicrobium sp.]